MTAVHVAQASRLQPRYVEEWLKGMTSGGYVVYDPAAETFQLADEKAFLLATESTDHFMGGLFLIAPRCCVRPYGRGGLHRRRSNSTRSVKTESRRSLAQLRSV